MDECEAELDALLRERDAREVDPFTDLFAAFASTLEQARTAEALKEQLAAAQELQTRTQLELSASYASCSSTASELLAARDLAARQAMRLGALTSEAASLKSELAATRQLAAKLTGEVRCGARQTFCRSEMFRPHVESRTAGRGAQHDKAAA